MTGTSGGLANFSSTEHWIDLSMVLLCILSAGLAAGLTIGLISIDRNELRLMSINGTEIQKKQAAKILPLIKDHHWLLVTLFLFNATANEALPVFLTGLVPEYAAIA
jgi:metal transporter CNNM